jgi:hypothetical protein
MNIEDMIMSGASDEEVAQALAALKQEKAAKDEAERQAKEMAAQKSESNALKAEARAYLINALLAYGEAFGLLTHEEIEEMDEEDIKELEAYLIQVEAFIPLMIKMGEMKEEMKDFKIDPDMLGTLFGM